MIYSAWILTIGLPQAWNDISNMNWTKQNAGHVIRAAQAKTGNLLLHVGNTEPMLVIATNYGVDDGGHYLIISSDPNTNGLVMKQYFTEYVWDVSDIAHLKLDLTATEVRSTRLGQGVIAVGKDGELFIDPNTNGQRETFPLISLTSLDFAKPHRKELVCFPRWKIVAGEDESETILFEWTDDSEN